LGASPAAMEAGAEPVRGSPPVGGSMLRVKSVCAGLAIGLARTPGILRGAGFGSARGVTGRVALSAIDLQHRHATCGSLPAGERTGAGSIVGSAAVILRERKRR